MLSPEFDAIYHIKSSLCRLYFTFKSCKVSVVASVAGLPDCFWLKNGCYLATYDFICKLPFFVYKLIKEQCNLPQPHAELNHLILLSDRQQRKLTTVKIKRMIHSFFANLRLHQHFHLTTRPRPESAVNKKKRTLKKYIYTNTSLVVIYLYFTLMTNSKKCLFQKVCQQRADSVVC